ncbi:class I SAM-dependent methyltransferase [soil metagenome]
MKDIFSNQAAAYAKYRPQYPPALFEYIMSFVKHKDLAWDCGTGNGQTAKELSKYFQQVHATDISSKQIEHATNATNIMYAVEPAEKTSLTNESTDLIAVSQALHWFKLDEFYTEVKRVSKPGGIIAVWTYSLLQIDKITDALVHQFHFEILGPYWDEERKFVDNGYQTISFPFEQIESPMFQIEVEWGVEDLTGYFNTWSALQKYIAAKDENPVPALMEKIGISWPAWKIKKVIFPIHLKLAYINK